MLTIQYYNNNINLFSIFIISNKYNTKQSFLRQTHSLHFKLCKSFVKGFSFNILISFNMQIQDFNKSKSMKIKAEPNFADIQFLI